MTKIIDLSGAREALPIKAEYGCIDEVVGRNMTIDELSNVHLEVDMEAMIQLMSDKHSGNYREARIIVETFALNIDKWARLVRK